MINLKKTVGIAAIAAVVAISGCATSSGKMSQSPPCSPNEPIHFKKPDPLFDPPAWTHYSQYCGENKVAVVRGPRMVGDPFGFKHLKPATYRCIDIPVGTIPLCLR